MELVVKIIIFSHWIEICGFGHLKSDQILRQLPFDTIYTQSHMCTCAQPLKRFQREDSSVYNTSNQWRNSIVRPPKFFCDLSMKSQFKAWVSIFTQQNTYISLTLICWAIYAVYTGSLVMFFQRNGNLMVHRRTMVITTILLYKCSNIVLFFTQTEDLIKDWRDLCDFTLGFLLFSVQVSHDVLLLY